MRALQRVMQRRLSPLHLRLLLGKYPCGHSGTHRPPCRIRSAAQLRQRGGSAEHVWQDGSQAAREDGSLAERTRDARNTQLTLSHANRASSVLGHKGSSKRPSPARVTCCARPGKQRRSRGSRVGAAMRVLPCTRPGL